MNKILAKQVMGMVDSSSDQEVDGKKTFNKDVVFDKGTNNFDIVIHEGFIYWVQDRNQLNQEGNMRMGVFQGMLMSQTYMFNEWRYA